VTYYRGLKTPARERESRFHSAGSTRRERQGMPGGKSLFLKLFVSGEEPEARREKKVYAYYRPGVTPVDDTPGFSAKAGTWVTQAPAWGKLKWVFRLAGVALLIGMVVWSRAKTTALLQDVAGLKLGKVSVEGNHYLTQEEIIRTVALPLGENMFKLDLEQATEKVKQLDWVERVFIERRLPSSILISVRERRPVALLDNGGLYGVDAEGRLLSSSPALLSEDLPLVSGVRVTADAVGTTKMAESLRPALDFFAFLGRKDGALAQEISEVNLSEGDSLKVTFIDGIQAVFDQQPSEMELKRMALVLSDLNEKGKRAGTMDFRYRDMVLVKTRE
jgi:cell division protein FtsQ